MNRKVSQIGAGRRPAGVWLLILTACLLCVLSACQPYSSTGMNTGTANDGKNHEDVSQPAAQTLTLQPLSPGDDIYQVAYVDPAQVEVTAPERLRNVLVIEIESMETTMFDKKHGGAWKNAVTPYLQNLLDDPDGIHFSRDDKGAGMSDSYGSTWTVASLVSNTAGLPLNLPDGLNNAYHSTSFLQGAYSLGDMLEKFGYKNVMISASRTYYGGIGEYFAQHGHYDVIEEKNVASHGLSYPDSQKGDSGFSDEACFRMARQLVTELDEQSQPWHLFISTMDTHFTGYVYEADPENGYLGTYDGYKRKVDNVYATTDKIVGEFVEWFKQQPCYRNTTVLIIGDHLNMSKYYLEGKDTGVRARYNLILNPVNKDTFDNVAFENRIFTALDTYPTILAAAGFSIEGNRLGFGVNLLSGSQTLAEYYGLEKMNEYLTADSDYYIDTVMGREDYDKIQAMREDQ